MPDADAVQRVLSQTVLGHPLQSTLTPSTVPVPQVSARPTAAHPRAYLGTKYKPPKLKTAASQDWRPALCDPQSLRSLAADAAAEAATELRLPDRFRVSLYPLVRRQTDTEVAETLALYWAMSLDSDPERLAAVTYLFCLHSDQASHGWCQLILSQSPGALD